MHARGEGEVRDGFGALLFLVDPQQRDVAARLVDRGAGEFFLHLCAHPLAVPAVAGVTQGLEFWLWLTLLRIRRLNTSGNGVSVLNCIKMLECRT